MHFNHILLIRAKDKKDSIEKIQKFLEPYYSDRGNDPKHERVWDWYQFGGRFAWAWNTDEGKQLQEKIVDEKGFYRQKTVGGLDPIRLNYEFLDKVNKEPYDTEVLPVVEANKHKIWDLIKISNNSMQMEIGRCLIEIQAYKKKIFEEHEESKHAKGMIRYYRKISNNLLKDRYNSYSYFYDIEQNTHHLSQWPTRINDIIKTPIYASDIEYYLVNVDLHN